MSRSSDATAKEIIDRASHNQEVNSIYSQLNPEEQRAVYSSLWKQTVIGNQAPGLEITGLDSNGDGLADKLKSVLNKASGAQLYQPEARNGEKPQSATGASAENLATADFPATSVEKRIKPQFGKVTETSATAMFESVEQARSDLWQPIARQFNNTGSKEIWGAIQNLDMQASLNHQPDSQRVLVYQHLTRLLQGEDPAFNRLSDEDKKSRLINQLEAAGNPNLPSVEGARSDLWQPIARQFNEKDGKEIWASIPKFEEQTRQQGWSEKESALFLEKLARQTEAPDSVLAHLKPEEKKQALIQSLESAHLPEAKPTNNQEGADNQSGKTPDKAQEKTENPKETQEQASQSYRQERQHLLDQAKQSMDAEAFATFNKNLQGFEQRAGVMKDSLVKQGFTDEQAQLKTLVEFRDTYREVSRLLEAKDNIKESPITGPERVKLAGQVIANAAEPTSISQGNHNTCNVTTVEIRTYTRNPSLAAKLVTDMATHSEYTDSQGTKVNLDQGSLRPDSQASQEKTVDGTRSFASQLFQVTAVNLYYQKHNPSVHYEQGAPNPTATPPESGERLMDYSKKPPQPMAYGTFEKWWDKKDDSDFKQPYLYDSRILEIGNAITGEKDNSWIIGHKNQSDATSLIDSPQALQTALLEAKHQGKFPVVLKVNTNNEPFYTDSGRGAAGGSGGWHVVTITDIKETSPMKVALDNQWSNGVDHLGDRTVNLSDLYRATKSPEYSLPDLRNEVKAAQQAGTPDHYKELQLLSLEKRYGGLPDDQYEQQLVDKLAQFSKYKLELLAKGNLTGDQATELNKANEYANEKFWTLSPAKMTETLEKQATMGFYSSSDYDRYLAHAIFKTKQAYENSSGDSMNANTTEAVKRLAKLMDSLPPERQEAIRKDLQSKYQDQKKAK